MQTPEYRKPKKSTRESVRESYRNKLIGFLTYNFSLLSSQSNDAMRVPLEALIAHYQTLIASPTYKTWIPLYQETLRHLHTLLHIHNQNVQHANQTFSGITHILATDKEFDSYFSTIGYIVRDPDTGEVVGTFPKLSPDSTAKIVTRTRRRDTLKPKPIPVPSVPVPESDLYASLFEHPGIQNIFDLEDFPFSSFDSPSFDYPVAASSSSSSSSELRCELCKHALDTTCLPEHIDISQRNLICSECRS
jgi:hypothetical protein